MGADGHLREVRAFDSRRWLPQCRPSFNVGGEPVSEQNVTVRKKVLTFLRTQQSRHGFARRLISQGLAVLEKLTDRVALMQQDRIIEEAPCDALCQGPRAPQQ